MEDKTETYQQDLSERSTASQIFTAALANFTGVASGAAFGFSAIIIPSRTTISNSFSLNYNQLSWIASVIFITNLFGCCIGGIISDAWGRKPCLLLSNAICFLGWTLIGIAYYCLPPYQFILLLIGRLLTGFSIGSANVTTLVYVAETSNLKLRPMLTTRSGLFSIAGTFLVYLLGFCFGKNWAIISIITSTAPLISFISIAFCLPESSTWLNSKKSMPKVTKTHRVQSSDAEEKSTLLEKKENKSSSTKILQERLLQRTCLIPTLIIVCYFFFLNLSGFYVIIAYAANFVFILKIPLDTYLVMCSFAVARLVGIIFISIFSKNMGRRCASILSGVTMTLSIFSIAIYLKAISTTPDEKLKLLFWLPTILMWIYISACTVGFATIPFAMVGEIFPLNIRGIASGISVSLNSLFTFLAIKIYPSFMQTFGAYELMLIYGFISLVGTIFVILVLPETKDKTLKEIEEYFANCTSLREFKVLK